MLNLFYCLWINTSLYIDCLYFLFFFMSLCFCFLFFSTMWLRFTLNQRRAPLNWHEVWSILELLQTTSKVLEDIHHHIFSYIFQMFVIMSITTLKSLLSHSICKCHDGTLRKTIIIFWISGWEKVPKQLINWLLMNPSVWWLFVITHIAIAANNAPSIHWQDYLSSLLKCVWINTKAVFQSCWRKRIIRRVFFSLCRERLTALDWCYSGKTALMSLHPGDFWLSSKIRTSATQ